MKIKKIFWITADYFIDVDYPIMKHINQKYDLYWLIVNSKRNVCNHQEGIREFTKINNIKFEQFNLSKRYSDFRIIIDYLKIILSIKKHSPDLIYFNSSGFPYFLPLICLFFNKKKIIFAAHNVSVPKGAINEKLITIYQNIILKYLINIQVFSQNQFGVLSSKFGKKNVLTTKLPLYDFGSPSIYKKNEIITFLFFGYIRDYKRVDLLIEAANMVYEQTKIKFKVIIAGTCEDWNEKYNYKIKYPALYELVIKTIPDDEVANYFFKSHYIVMPYQDIAQSGVLSIAMNYNLPIIASNMKSFEEFIINNKTGFLFDNYSAEGLKDMLLFILNNHSLFYDSMLENLRNYVKENYSPEVIVLKYTNYLDKI